MDQVSNYILTIALTSLTVIYLLYKCSTRNFKYWEERGVPYIKPSLIVGNFWKTLTFQKQMGHHLGDLYNQIDNPYFGIFLLNQPLLVIKCPELIKSILVKDFQRFANRTVVSDVKTDSFGARFLFFVRNPEWKVTRFRMAPAFSTGKLKLMLVLMNYVSEDLKNYVAQNMHKDSIEAKELFAKFATDIIGTCAFGIEANSFKYEDAEFRNMGKLAFDFKWKRGIIQGLSFMIPGVIEFLKIPFFDQTLISFMRNVFWETFHDRKKSKHSRNDLIDLLIQIHGKSKPSDDFEFVGDMAAAQAGQFFVASFETVSSTMAFTLYELCIQPDIQNKVREEIKRTLLKHGKMTYNFFNDIPYLEMVLNETLRKYPTLPFLDRRCTEDYRLPNSNLVIEKGTPVYIPMFGLHYDSQYFPDPEKFIPERFSPENTHSFPEYAYLPFGKGPRSCIGARFGFLTCKMGIAHLLSEYEVIPTKDTPVPLIYETKGVLLGSTRGLPVKFKKLDV